MICRLMTQKMPKHEKSQDETSGLEPHLLFSQYGNCDQHLDFYFNFEDNLLPLRHSSKIISKIQWSFGKALGSAFSQNIWQLIKM